MELLLNLKNDALFLDIDGTLLNIASTPDTVVVPKGMVATLEILYKKLGGALALVSGRTLESIDMLFFPLLLPAAGAHGAVWRIAGETDGMLPLPANLRHEIDTVFSQYPALIIEDKKYSICVHYRQAPEMKNNVHELLKLILSRSTHCYTIMAGKMVFEVVYNGHNKGKAVEFFMSQPPFAGRRPIYLGDDETDIFAIDACNKAGGIGIKVEKNNELFSSPEHVTSWLEINSQ